MKRRRHTPKNRYARRAKRFVHKWILNRRGVFIAAILVSGGIVAFEYSGTLSGNNSTPTPGWFIDGNQLQSLIDYTSSSLPQHYFNNQNTVVMNSRSETAMNFIPSGWQSQAGNHYTSFGTTNCFEGKCYSLMRDLQVHNGTTANNAKYALYDDEYWGRTPGAEQANPCDYMSKFVSTAHLHGLTTVVAPDQDLAEPGIITQYQGGESENWQAYLRLGLAACAAKTGSEWYHIMSQPFESNWCSNPFEECQSSESDFDNYVTQAALQAKAYNRSIKLADGLSTNPNYFGYFRGTQTFAKTIYQDYVDTRQTVNAVWMNVIGKEGNLTTIYFLSLISRGAQAQPRSSVWFFEPNKTLRNTQTSNTHTQSFSLSKTGSSILFSSNQTMKAKTNIPAGTGDLQLWTDGTPDETAQINVSLGYCKGSSCSQQTPLANMIVSVPGGSKGVTVPTGAFTTDTDTALPNKGTYHLYVKLSVAKPATFNLQYGDDTPTNLSTPIVLPVK